MKDKQTLDNADKNLPTLNYAVALQKIAASQGFDWNNVKNVIVKIHEELDEVTSELGVENNHARLVDEIGDLLFACTNLARHLNVDPEQALQHGNQKFYRRFSAIENHIQSEKASFDDYSLEQLDSIWNLIKQQESNALK
ncbi:MAG: MazG nucleotide pyrophosphohydrolase domain-containing protein [Gammaproteobacteria bacterium]|nr:MazG nucleotide pyrophosphohydrolase domain-containing protein [Gammaproteobacteria bacterium]